MAVVLIQAAAQAGAHAVKFQTFEAQEFIHRPTIVPSGHDPVIDARFNSSDHRMFKLFLNGGLPRAWHKDMMVVAKDHGIAFLSTPFSVSGAKFLVEEVGIQAIKIASGDVTFFPLMEYASWTGLPIIMSTGAATLQEIRDAVDGPLYKPYSDGKLAILHCRSVYPCPLESVGIQAIMHLKEEFPLAETGLSDHTLSIEAVPALAVSEGATIYEKHLRLDLPRESSADTYHSITPSEFLRMSAIIRCTNTIIYGTDIDPVEEEHHDRLWARRSQEDWLRPTEEARQGQWD